MREETIQPHPTSEVLRMRTRSFALAIAAMLLVALAASVSVAAADEQSGTWKMNSAKSKFSPGPAPKEVTVKIEADENHIKVNADGTNGDGTPIHVEYDAKFDGKDYPATGYRTPILYRRSGSKGAGLKHSRRRAA